MNTITKKKALKKADELGNRSTENEDNCSRIIMLLNNTFQNNWFNNPENSYSIYAHNTNK